MPEIQAAADEESSELGILLLLIYTNSKISQDSAKKTLEFSITWSLHVWISSFCIWRSMIEDFETRDHATIKTPEFPPIYLSINQSIKSINLGQPNKNPKPWWRQKGVRKHIRVGRLVGTQTDAIQTRRRRRNPSDKTYKGRPRNGFCCLEKLAPSAS